MAQIILIGIAAGAAAALLFASVASGSPFSILLFYLSPLPIMIAAVGWSHLSGLVGSLLAASALGLAIDRLFFVAFLVGVGIPAWWLSYLALLARPSGRAAGAGDEGGLEWYPIGRIVVWAAVLGAGVVSIAILSFGINADTFEGAMRRGFERLLRVQTRTPPDTPLHIPGMSDPNRLIDFLVVIVPPMAAVLSTLTNLINLWLAARVVRISGRLRRAWPQLAAMTFPPFAPALLAGAIVGTFLPGMVGIVSVLFAAALLMAYAMLGLAVLHMITTGLGARGFILAGVYAAIIVFGWPLLVIIVLGLADGVLGLRDRITGKRGPPSIT